MSILGPGRIRHSVVYTLKHPAGSDQERDFLETAERTLSAIPGVEELEVLREVSPKNDWAFGISMEFASEDAYRAYNEHPDHVGFVESRWEHEVADFMEIDLVIRDGA